MAVEDVGIRLTLQQRRETAKGLQDTARDVKSIGSAAEDTGRRASRSLSVLRSIGSAAAGAAKLGTQGLLALAGAGGTWGTRIAAANEQADISFTTMLGSAEKAGSFISDLQGFAAKTPFEFSGLQQSASSLISAGIEANKVIPIMTSLGNATSGMGTGSEGIQRATVALQQMNAAGKITGEDLNQLRDAGVPVFDLLAAATGKSVEQVAELAQKGKLGRRELEQLMSALETGKGLERFNGLMDKQSQSLTGMWSSFTDTISMGLGRVMEPWLPAMKKALGGATGAATPFFDTLTKKSAEWAAKAPQAIEIVRQKFRDGKADVDSFLAGLRGSGPIDGATGKLNTLGLGISALAAAYHDGDVTSDGFVGTMETIGATAGRIAESIKGADISGAVSAIGDNLPAVNSILSVTGVVAGFLASHLDTLAALMPVLAGGFLLWKVAQLGANVAATAAVPVHIAQVIATRQLAAANRALAASNGLVTTTTTAQTGAQNVGILARGRAVVGMAAQRAAMLAAAAATGVVTAAQWLWNVALSANPIGLVVLAVAALVAGVILAYKKFKWFRDIIGWVWDKLKGLWDIAKKVGGFFGSIFGGGDDSGGGGGGSSRKPPGRAGGGPVEADRAYIVGERRPELFVPEVSGTILPRIPNARAASDTDGALAGIAPGGDLHAHVELDGREIGVAVIRDFRQRQARQ